MARSSRAVLLFGWVLGLVGCVDTREPTALAPLGPDYTIADAATGWNPAFYWLPPIVPPFVPSGVFDGSRAPLVRICAWSSGSCQSQIAEYSLSTGTGGERVTVDPVAEHYQVMWRTGSSAIQPLTVGGVYRILVFLDGREAGFADALIVARPRDRGSVDETKYVPVVRGSNFKIKFRIEIRTQLLDLHIDRKGDGALGQGEDPTTYAVTVTNDPSGTMTAFYTDGITQGLFIGERRLARANPVVRMVYSDVDYFAVWAGRQNPDNSIEGAWFDAAGQTGDFRLVGQGETVTRSTDAGTLSIPSTYMATSAAELDGDWTLDFDRTYDGVYVPEPGGTNPLAFTASSATELSAVYTDGNSGSYEGALYTARYTSVITLLFTNTDYFAAFAGAMTDPNTIVGVYFDAEGYSGDFVLTRLLPDLTPTDIAGPSTAVAGQASAVTVAVGNIGAGWVSGGWGGEIRLSADGWCESSAVDPYALVYTEPTALAAGANTSASWTATIPATITPGTYHWCVIVDWDPATGRIQELNEGNNTLVGNEVTISGLPDLAPTEVLGPSTGLAGQAVSVAVGVQNIGTVGVSGGWGGEIRLSADGWCESSAVDPDALVYTETTALAVGASTTATRTATIPATITPGTYHWCVIVDWDPATGRIQELNEGNNTLVGNVITISSSASLQTRRG